MREVLFTESIVVALLIYCGSLFFLLGVLVMFVAQRKGLVIGFELGRWAGAAQGYERGKQDAQPLRASNGWFVGRGK
jgi:hypothetical protein